MGEEMKFEKSSGNVFKDLGLPDADELFLKAKLGFEVFRSIEDRQLTQAQAAKILGVKQPEISRLKKGKFNHYSVERLLTFLNRLNRDTVQTEEKMLKWAKEKPWVRKELGEYEEVCQAFAQKVSQLDGVVTIGAIPYAGYVDLWTVTARDNRDLGKAIIEHFIKVVRKSDLGLLFDFMITSKREHLPEEAIVLYEKE